MGLTVEARLLLIGLWNEAFDDGVFEWKPLRLKARLFPADNVDMDNLLAQLLHAAVIARINDHPKQPGVIRNFRRFQRPKKPNSSGMLPRELHTFVGLEAPNSTPIPDQFSTGGELPPLMEEEGGRGRREFSEPEGSGGDAPTTSLEVDLFRRGKQVLGMSAGGVVANLRRHCGGDPTKALEFIEIAAAKENPMEWIQAVLRKPAPDALIYRNVL